MFQMNFELLACWCMESGEQKVISDNKIETWNGRETKEDDKTKREWEKQFSSKKMGSRDQKIDQSGKENFALCFITRNYIVKLQVSRDQNPAIWLVGFCKQKMLTFFVVVSRFQNSRFLIG